MFDKIDYENITVNTFLQETFYKIDYMSKIKYCLFILDKSLIDNTSRIHIRAYVVFCKTKCLNSHMALLYALSVRLQNLKS